MPIIISMLNIGPSQIDLIPSNKYRKIVSPKVIIALNFQFLTKNKLSNEFDT